MYMPELEATYTIEQVAKRYHRTTITVARWVNAGRLTAINTGGGRRGPYVFREEDLNDFDRRSMIGYVYPSPQKRSGKRKGKERRIH